MPLQRSSCRPPPAIGGSRCFTRATGSRPPLHSPWLESDRRRGDPDRLDPACDRAAFLPPLIKSRPLIRINASDFEIAPDGGQVGSAVGYLSASSELLLPPGIRKVDEMGSWLVPPIVIPVLIVIMVVAYGLYRAYS